ncbi:MAG TPA: MFS transporter permease [Actinomycetes bacterium]|nr:MFS transporter permease [Actinomycetes bacterium]
MTSTGTAHDGSGRSLSTRGIVRFGAHAFDGWWFTPVPRARVAAFRVLVYVFIPLDVLWLRPWGAAHGYVDPELYRPLLIGRLLPLPAPTSTLVHVVQYGLVLVALTLVVLVVRNAAHRWQTWLGATAFLLYLEWMFISFSYGKVDHDRFGYMVALAVLPTAGRAALRDMRPSQAAGWAFRMVQVGVVATYFLAAIAKVRFGGWGWVNSTTIARAVIRRGTMFADPLLQMPWTLQLTQWFIVTLEFASPVLLFIRPRWQQFVVIFLLSFHVMTYLMIRIIFMPHVVCLAAFLPLERILNRESQPTAQ